DGDTLRLSDGRSVRMIGLNAPETGKKGQSAQPFAEAAKRRLQTLVDDSGGQVSLRVGEQATDHYGRTLANVYGRNGANLEAQLLAEGLGYLVAVTNVQRNGGGIWIEFSDALVLRIAPDLLRQFDSATLLRLKGQRIEARGWIVDRSRRGGLKADQARWMMPITHPVMLNTT
nr:hypothetical protein [Tanacetum cinerariifolium]